MGLLAHHGALLASGATEFNVLPNFAIYSIDHLQSDGRVVANRYAATAPSKNILSLNTGYIKSAGGAGVITNFFANGPTNTGSASRVQLAADATVLGIFTGAPPADTYRLTFKVKLNAGGPTKNLRYGNSTVGYLTVTINDSTWTAVTLDFSPNGANYTSVNILPAVGHSPIDLLLDDLQWYPDDAFPIPAFSTEVPAWHFKPRAKGYPGGFTRVGNLLDNNAAGGCGLVTTPAFPAATTYLSFTAIVAFKYRTLGSGQMLVTETDAVLGTTASTFQIGTSSGTVFGQLTMQPISSGNTRVEPLGEGWHLYAVRVKSGARSSHFNGIELNSASSAYSGFAARLLNIGGQTTATPAKGDFGIVAFWGSAVDTSGYLSDADFAQAHAKVRADVEEMGEVMGALPYFFVAEGDSITAAASSPQGPSYAYINAAAGNFAGRPPLYLRNLAVSGSGIATVETRKATALAVVAQAIAAGAQPIVSLLIGSNDTTEIATNGYLAYYAKLASYLADMRAAGALTVLCTHLPANVGNPTWDAQRALLCAHERTRAGIDFDVLADFAADPDMGPDGAPAAGIYYVDTLHPKTAGHVILGGIFKTAIQSLPGW